MVTNFKIAKNWGTIFVKDDNLLHRMWKLALIKKYICSKDGQNCSEIIQLAPNKELVSRAINHSFPLELQDTQSKDVKNEAKVTSNESVASELIGDSQPLRNRAAYRIMGPGTLTRNEALEHISGVML